MNTEPKATIPGGAGTVTASKYLEDVDSLRVVGDCGLLQNASDYGLDVEIPADDEDARGASVTDKAKMMNEERKVLNWKIVSLSLGAWAAVSFVACVIWGLLTPEALHMHAFLEQILPAFKWLTWWSIPLGLVESFLLGFYAGIVYVPIHNFFTKRWGRVA